jgi:hypothetical protein
MRRDAKVETAAVELLRNNPWMSRRAVNRQLREMFGRGLRSAYVNELQRVIIAQHRESVELAVEARPPEHFNNKQKRQYMKLLDAGFTRSEARELATVSTNVPYLKDMIVERRRLKRRAIRMRITKKEWRNWIKRHYAMRFRKLDDKHPDKERVMGIVARRGMGGLNRSVWGMLRWFEEHTKDKYPWYKSPSKTRQPLRGSFVASKAAKAMGEQKYPKGRHYR